jgi:hypothetical protein
VSYFADEELEIDPLDAPHQLQINVTIGAMADFSWSDKKWWPSINVEAYTRDFSLPGGSDTGRYGVGGTNFNGSTSAIVLTVAGITIPMLADESDVAITGSITLTPVSWLTVE